jgi:hypothetical protein
MVVAYLNSEIVDVFFLLPNCPQLEHLCKQLFIIAIAFCFSQLTAKSDISSSTHCKQRTSTVGIGPSSLKQSTSIIDIVWHPKISNFEM